MNRAPIRIIKFKSSSAARFAGFYERSVADEVEIARGIGCVAECEPPVSIEGKSLAHEVADL
jgi:hypothetical protein